MSSKGAVHKGKVTPASKGASAPKTATGGAGSGDGQGGPVLRHADEAVASILARDAYQRERHYFMMRTIVVLGAALIGSTALNFYLATRPPIIKHFISDGEGKIKELVALDRPVNTLTDVSTWITNSIAQAYTFSFANYRQELSASRVNFTAGGWKGFEKALSESGNLKAVIDNKYVTTAVPTGAAVLQSQGLIEGRYAWKFQVPMLVTYQSAVQRTTQNLMVTAIVVRQPETEHPRGLGIASLIAE